MSDNDWINVLAQLEFVLQFQYLTSSIITEVSCK